MAIIRGNLLANPIPNPIAKIGNDWELVWNKISPLLSHIIAKIFYKYFCTAVIYQ